MKLSRRPAFTEITDYAEIPSHLFDAADHLDRMLKRVAAQIRPDASWTWSSGARRPSTR